MQRHPACSYIGGARAKRSKGDPWPMFCPPPPHLHSIPGSVPHREDSPATSWPWMLSVEWIWGGTHASPRSNLRAVLALQSPERGRSRKKGNLGNKWTCCMYPCSLDSSLTVTDTAGRGAVQVRPEAPVSGNKGGTKHGSVGHLLSQTSTAGTISKPSKVQHIKPERRLICLMKHTWLYGTSFLFLLMQICGQGGMVTSVGWHAK